MTSFKSIMYTQWVIVYMVMKRTILQSFKIIELDLVFISPKKNYVNLNHIYKFLFIQLKGIELKLSFKNN